MDAENSAKKGSAGIGLLVKSYLFDLIRRAPFDFDPKNGP